MKIKRLVIALLLGFIIQSCSNDLNISITEELDVENLRENMENNPGFEDFYKFAMDKRSIVMSSNINQAKWGEITYQELKEAYDCSNPLGCKKWEKIWEEWEKDYSELVRKYVTQTDSIFDYWKRYKNETALDSYAKIEFVGIEKEEVWNLHYGKAIPKTKSRAKFKITPLKGELKELRFKVHFYRQEHRKEITSVSSKRVYDGDVFAYFIDKDTIISGDLDGLDIYLKNKEIDEDKLKNDFVFKSFIYQIEDEDYQLKKFDKTIPESILEYIAFEDEFMKESCLSEIISKYIDTDFPSRELYYDMRTGHAIDEINPKLLDLIDY